MKSKIIQYFGEKIVVHLRHPPEMTIPVIVRGGETVDDLRRRLGIVSTDFSRNGVPLHGTSQFLTHRTDVITCFVKKIP